MGNVKVEIYLGVHNTTMIDIINPIDNFVNQFFALYSAFGDKGTFRMHSDENLQCLQIECVEELYSLAQTSTYQRAFERMGIDVTIKGRS